MTDAFIDNILTCLKEQFQDEWIKEYLKDDDGSITESNKSKVKDKINKLLDITVDSFFKSLISGKYFVDTRKIIDKINRLREESNISLNQITSNFESDEFLKETLKGYVDVLKIFSSLYLGFIKLVQSQNENPNIDIVYQSNFDTDKKFEGIQNSKVKNDILLFKLIVLIYQIDHFFDDNENTYRAINFSTNNLKEFKESEYFVALKKKLNFLKYKWEIRQKSYKRTNFKLSKAYIIEDELFVSTNNIVNNSGIPKLQQWGEYIECYYELDDWDSKLNNITIDFKHEPYENLSVLKLVFLLKYFKDIDKNYKNIKEVVDEFERRYEENKNSEIRFWYNKTYLYALNNQFSLLLEQTNTDESEIDNLKSKIIQIQGKCNIDNYFIESKYIKYRLKYLKSIFENRNELADLSKYNNELDELSSSLKTYKEKLNWSKDNHNLLFQLPYEECLIDSDTSDISVFYASSISLPLPHQESQNIYESIDSELKELKQSVLSYENLKKEFNVIKDLKVKQDKTLEEIKKNQIKTFEIIGIVVAIMSFIFGSVQSFKFITDIYQAFLFTLTMGVCLILMICSVFFYTKKHKYKSKIIITGGVIYFIIISILLAFSIDKIGKKFQNKQYYKLDSIQKVQIYKIDSIEKKYIRKIYSIERKYNLKTDSLYIEFQNTVKPIKKNKTLSHKKGKIGHQLKNQ